MPEQLTEGMVIDVVVDSVEDYGICIRYSEQKGLIQIIDISWNLYRIQEKIHDLFRSGQIIQVVVTGVTPEKFFASIKDLAPEKNPWRDPSVYRVGSSHEGEVEKAVDFGFFIKLEYGAVALLPKGEDTQALRENDTVKVVVTDIDEKIQKVKVRLSK